MYSLYVRHTFLGGKNVENGMLCAGDSEMKAESQQYQAPAYVNKNTH